jgi:hypothetical protein
VRTVSGTSRNGDGSTHRPTPSPAGTVTHDPDGPVASAIGLGRATAHPWHQTLRHAVPVTGSTTAIRTEGVHAEPSAQRVVRSFDVGAHPG